MILLINFLATLAIVMLSVNRLDNFIKNITGRLGSCSGKAGF